MSNHRRQLGYVAFALLWITVCVFLWLPARAETDTADGETTGRVDRMDFVRDIQPILAERCFACHGPDAQEGQLRLDAKAIVFRGGISGPLLNVGHGKQSLLYRRIAGLGNADRMPLDDQPLTDEQIERIRRWIDEGASWPDGVGANVGALQQHWAYVKPVRPEPLAIANPAWIKTPIDNFILARLEQEGISPSPPADRATLIRRVYLDLIGLPPTVEEVDAFVHDTRPDAYEQVVDRLLASQQYGVRWARPWLDVARYADTNGYQADQYREVWPYRDWVINAINEDLPFDQFTIEQLAGDLLPDAMLSQKIATGFHRLTTCNVEAGVDPEENRINQVIDRVNTTGTVWLGTTIACTQCHNHKYDPFTQQDYYRLFAYFNNTPLEVEGNGVQYEFVGPKMELPLGSEQQAHRQQLQQPIDELQERLDKIVKDAEQNQPAGEQSIAAAMESAPGLPDAIMKILALPADKRTAEQQRQLSDYYVGLQGDVKKLREQIAALKKQLNTIEPQTTLVMVEMDQPRATHVFQRGNFLDKGQAVTPATPDALHPLPPGAAPDRLTLARWLVSPDNPLVGRVTVNRWWAEIFGQGIVATTEDFGSQGEPPTHRELLDWLAVEFIECGWSMKHIHKLIAMSATYQQSSRVTPELISRDPYNKRYARGPRFRLPAETVRDNALAISGLLCNKTGGPPVYPPQPDGLWRHVGRNAPKYDTSQGADRFRRGIYVFWRRSAPYPSFVNFDAPDRASCVVNRPRTNTPLQALTLLNDPAYVEMAAALARRIMTDHAEMTVEQRVAYAFRLCVAREAKAAEAEHLQDVYRRELARFEADAKAALAVVSKFPEAEDIDAARLAAWFYVANILLNLDETITKG